MSYERERAEAAESRSEILAQRNAYFGEMERYRIALKAARAVIDAARLVVAQELRFKGDIRPTTILNLAAKIKAYDATVKERP